MYVCGLLLFILGIEKRNLTYSGCSFVMFIILWAQSIYIEIPWIAVTGSADYVTGTQQFIDPAVGASCWLFIVIDILIFVHYFLGFWRKRRGEEPAMP